MRTSRDPATPRSGPSRRDALRRPAFWGRVAQFLAGLAGMGLGLAVMLEAGIGLGPWAVFHEGIARVTPLSFGQALMIVGVVIAALAWWWTSERPGPGTVVNMLLVGPFVDLFRAVGVVPVQDGLTSGTVQFLVGAVIVGTSSGLYISARFGAGPRDMFVLGLSRLLGGSVRRTRTAVEVVVLVVGVVLGGSIGLGTILFALVIGPSMQTSLRLFGPPPPARAAVGD